MGYTLAQGDPFHNIGPKVQWATMELRSRNFAENVGESPQNAFYAEK